MPFPVYTQQDLARRVLVRLGEVGFGQSEEAEALKRIADSLPALMAEFEADGIYVFARDAEVPAAAMDALSALIASKLSDDFGCGPDEVQVLAARAQAASELLRRLKYVGFAGRRRAATFY